MMPRQMSSPQIEITSSEFIENITQKQITLQNVYVIQNLYVSYLTQLCYIILFTHLFFTLNMF